MKRFITSSLIFSLRVLCGLFLLLCFCPQGMANNVQITNISLEDRNAFNDTAVVEFDIRWENSWKDDTNHDAIWVFVKVCVDSCAGYWKHAQLKTFGQNPADTDAGSNTDLDIKVPMDKMGAFIRRKATGSGTMSSTDVRLTIDYSSVGAADSSEITLKVFGIEMVYIPEAAFYLGDGNGSSYQSSRAFQTGTPSSTGVGNAAYISDAMSASIQAYWTTGDYDDEWMGTSGIYIDGDGGVGIYSSVSNALMPTGYKSFYLMKYEMSQGQYRDFLNTLPLAYQKRRVAATIDGDEAGDFVMRGEDATSGERQTLTAVSDPPDGPYTFGCDHDDDNLTDEVNDGEWIAMNYMSWMDMAAYADWAGLRPFTEVEYEKAARGPSSAVYYEKAWGSSTVNSATTSLSYTGQGLEVANQGNMNYASSYPDGPYRVGIFAQSATTRVSSGSGYYGNMELSGNVWEMTVSLGKTWSVLNFKGTHGDGTLTSGDAYDPYYGNATNNDWPGILTGTTNAGVNSAAGAGARGGGWGTDLTAARVSQRTHASYGGYVQLRYGGMGGRLARTDPFPATVIFGIDSMTTGNIGGRSGADTMCRNGIPSALAQDCKNIHALISISSSDEIQDMPLLYGYRMDLPVMVYSTWSGKFTRIADNWADMLDNSIARMLNDNLAPAYPGWTGSTSAGAVNASAYCSGFASTLGFGAYGSYESTTGTWLAGGSNACNDSTTFSLWCLCQYELLNAAIYVE